MGFIEIRPTLGSFIAMRAMQGRAKNEPDFGKAHG
jgi:hypothetical protein